MFNPRTKHESGPLSSKQSFPSSPSLSRNCASPSQARRPSSADGGEDLVKTRWSGYKKVLPTTVTSKQGQVQTRIPRLPRGKDNPRGRSGARVIKPVARPKQASSDEAAASLIHEDGDNLTTIKSKLSVSSTPTKPGARSPTFISSKTVPDLHNKILAKIRLHKRRSKLSKNLSSLQSSFKSPEIPDDMEGERNTTGVSTKEEYERDRESPVSGQDLEAYLASMFYMVDTYRTGLVRSSSLLEYLGSLVDLPKLDKWKLEELNRMLDPDKDNRYVDQALWSKVGQAWVEMMLDPGNHVDTSTGTIEDVDVDNDLDIQDTEQEVDSTGNASYGSVEGVGGDTGCSSKEVELENKVSELSYQLARMGEEKMELERNLAGSEEFALNLAFELEGSKKAIVHNMSTSFHRVEVLDEESEQVRDVQEKCCSLTMRVESLTKELLAKEDKLSDMEVMMVTLGEENEESKIREELMNKKLIEKFNKCATMEVQMRANIDLVNTERTAKENAEDKLEATQIMLQNLEMELSTKEEEIRNITRSRMESVESSGSCSLVHDVSVDDRVLMEENMDTQHEAAAPVLSTPSRVIQSSVTRGPSASSTPHKGRKGSIADELLEMEASSDLPSPFCEKKERGGRVRGEIMKMVNIMAESVRKILVNQVKPGQSGRAMVLLNKEISSLKKELDIKMIMTSSEEKKELQDKAFDLEEKLSEAISEISRLKSFEADNEVKNNIPLEVVQQVESRVEAMASLLQSTNTALLAATEGGQTPPDCSLEQETDLSSWQLDLEGIQLVDWNSQLGKRLAHYTRWGKKNSLAELSCRSPMAMLKSSVNLEHARSPASNGLLWQSLYKRLEDLHTATEVSRDLLLMAGDSLREQSVNQSSIMFPKTVACQTTPQLPQTKASQVIVPKTVNQAVQTTQSLGSAHSNPLSPCQMENCFCPSSQARSRNTIWYILFKAALYLILFLLFFTFICGFEIEQSQYYPITWYPLRRALGAYGVWLPQPVMLVSYKTIYAGVY